MRRIAFTLAALLSAALAFSQDGAFIRYQAPSGGAGIPGGSSGQVQYNNSSTFAGSTNLTFDGTTLTAAKIDMPGTETAFAMDADIIVNGTFTGSATGWTLGGGGGSPDWAYGANAVSHGNSGGTAALQPSTPLTLSASTYYVVQFTVSAYSAGTLTASLGGTAMSAVSRNGAYAFVVLTASTANLTFTPTTTFVGTIDTISVNKVTSQAQGKLTLSGTGGWKTVLQANAPGNANLSLTIGGTPFEYAPWAASNTFVGSTAGLYQYAGQDNTAIGQASMRDMAYGLRNTAYGSWSMQGVQANSDDNTALGAFSLNTVNLVKRNTMLGEGSGYHLSGDDNTCIGQVSCQYQAINASIGIGEGATPTASNQAVIGASGAGLNIADLYVGSGVTKTSPASFALHGTGGSGSNNAGSNFSIQPGLGTGTAAGGDLVTYRSPSIASGSTTQTAVVAKYVRSQAKTLTADTATIVFNVTGLGAHVRTGGAWDFCVEAADASNDQIACCRAQWAAIDTTAGAGGETCAVVLDKTCTAALEGAASSGTLAVTADTATGTDLCSFRLTSTSSLTETINRVTYTVTQNGTAGVVAPQ